MTRPLVSIIIPHYNGKEILQTCLRSLKQTSYPNIQIVLVDNASTDDSLDGVRDLYPDIRILRSETNLGYAGGCNAGLQKAEGDYIIFLNNDTSAPPDWISKLVDFCESDPSIAACQPKILSQSDPDTFDYAGAAGGLIDIFGYPFAKGRLFFTLEKDAGQYNEPGDIFWASGTAMMVRRSALDTAGVFDPMFFAHMEEIDLCWRLHLVGYRVVVVPDAVVYHRGGSTLKPDSPQKLFLNHRNSMLMLLKNYQPVRLALIFPVRICLEILTMFYALVKFDFARFRAVIIALIDLFLKSPATLRKRGKIRMLRRLPDAEVVRKMYRGSIVAAYFLRGIKTVDGLKNTTAKSKLPAV